MAATKKSTGSVEVRKVATFEGGSGRVTLSESEHYSGLFDLSVDGEDCGEYNADDLKNLTVAIACVLED